MVERIKNLGLRDEIIGGRRSSGFDPSSSGGSGIQTFLAGFEAIARNEKAEKIQAERAKEKALKTYLDTIEVESQTQIDVIANESPRNPQAIVNKATAYRDGVVKAAPPALQSLIKAKIDSKINMKRAVANKAATEEIQAQAKAIEERRVSQDFALLSEDSEGLYSNDFDVRNASESSASSFERELAIRLFAKDIDDFGVPFDLHTKEDITARLQSFRDISQSAAIKAWFREQPIPAEAYLQLLEGGFKVDMATFKGNDKEGIVEETFRQVNVMDTLSEKAHDDLLKDVESEITAINVIRTGAETIANKEQQLEWNNTGAALIQNLLTAPEEGRVAPDQIRLMGLAGELDPSKTADYIKLAVKPRPEFDNAELVKNFEFALDAGTDVSELLADPLISAQFKPATFTALSTQNQLNLDVAAGISEGPLKNEISTGLTLLKSSIQTGGVGGALGMVFQVDNKAVLRRMEAVKLYFIRTAPIVDPDTGRIAPPLESPIDVADDLIKRSLTGFLTTGIGGDLLLPLEYQGTREAMTLKTLDMGVGKLQKRFDAGVISRKIFNKNIILYERWIRLLPEIVKTQQDQQAEPAKKGAIPPRRTKQD